MLEDIIKHTYIDLALAKTHCAVAKNLEVYYERHYRGLLLQSSKDVHQCMTHALSHPTDPEFQCSCPHKHQAQCKVMEQDTALFEVLSVDIEAGILGLSVDTREHLKWQLQRCKELISKYKAHLLRKTWDRESYKRLLSRLTNDCALVIIDYGQKVEATKNIESQSDCFGKSGVSPFGATFLMLATAFEPQELESMLGEERVAKLKDDDLVAFTVVLYNSDANQVTFPLIVRDIPQSHNDTVLVDDILPSCMICVVGTDWIHSFLSLRGLLDIFCKRFPRMNNLLLRTDGASNFKGSAFVLGLIMISKWSPVKILEFSVSEAGGGKDITDRFLFCNWTQRLLRRVIRESSHKVSLVSLYSH